MLNDILAFQFEKFKTLVAYQVIQNISFTFILKDKEYITFAKDTQKRLKLFIHNLLTQLSDDTIKIIENVNEDQLNQLIHAVAGSGKRDKNINITNGRGLYFTGLTKLFFDIAHIYRINHFHENEKILAMFHLNDLSLANIKDPLHIINKIIEKTLY